MALFSVKNLTVTRGIKTLFENAAFSIEPKDKIAIIGPNGSGKTTLLSELIKRSTASDNDTAIKKGLRITHLAQALDIKPEDTILDHLFSSNTPVAKTIRVYQKCITQFNKNPSTEAEAALSQATTQMDHLKAWDYEARVNSILRELNILDLTQKMKELSGGMQKKVTLAQVFFEQTDILILDEPTNHLDIATIEWLELKLKRHDAAIVMVTHDRYFLDKVCTKILEIDQQQLFTYNGNYQVYLEQRDQRYAAQNKHEKSIQSVLRVELAWLKRGPKARSTKQKARKQRIDALLNRKEFSPEKVLEINTNSRRLGKKILTLKNISKSFDEQIVIKPFSYMFTRGEKIGLLGPNGSGKTTLLNLITERTKTDTGVVDAGINTVFGYFDQHSRDYDDSISIYKHVSEIGSQITCHDGTVLSAAKLLERFLFPSAMLKTPIGKLSGGEKRRLHLVCLLLENPNFLLFDEPTNDLDIQTLSVLEDFLKTFQGCILIISHDRYFMDRVVDQLLIFDGTGQISNFYGNYSDYTDTLKDLRALSNKKTKPIQNQIKSHDNQIVKSTKKLTNRDRETLKKLEKNIDLLELEKKELESIFSASTNLPTNYAEAGKRLAKITEDLETMLLDWEALAERV